MKECYLGLGANQQEPVRILNQALQKIRHIPGIALGKPSPIIMTPPFGIRGQPRFYNQVIQIYSGLPPLILLKHLQAIEQQIGKQTNLSWGPRKIDIDILLLGQTFLNNQRLTLPHPQIWQRPFVTQQLLAYQSPLVDFYLNLPNDQKIIRKKNNSLPRAIHKNLT